MEMDFTRDVCDKLKDAADLLRDVREIGSQLGNTIYRCLWDYSPEGYDAWVEEITSKYKKGKDYKIGTVKEATTGKKHKEYMIKGTIYYPMCMARTEELFRMALTRQQEKGDVDLEKVAYYRSKVYSEYKLTKL